MKLLAGLLIGLLAGSSLTFAALQDERQNPPDLERLTRRIETICLGGRIDRVPLKRNFTT